MGAAVELPPHDPDAWAKTHGRGDPPEGYRFAWAEASTTGPGAWRTIRFEGPVCRYRLAHTRCPRRAVVELNRGTGSERWWAYCAEHLFGKCLHAGHVFRIVTVELEGASS